MEEDELPRRAGGDETVRLTATRSTATNSTSLFVYLPSATASLDQTTIFAHVTIVSDSLSDCYSVGYVTDATGARKKDATTRAPSSDSLAHSHWLQSVNKHSCVTSTWHGHPHLKRQGGDTG